MFLIYIGIIAILSLITLIMAIYNTVNVNNNKKEIVSID